MAGITTRGSPEFSEQLKQAIWNKRLAGSREPDALIRAHSAEEVAEIIRFASASALKVSPRGGGHHYGAAALRDDGLLLDLSGLTFIEIDAASLIARVGAGVRGDKLIDCLAASGFAFPVGHCADVRLSGYLLNGGFGWNAGHWGAACCNIVAVEMVTPDGKIVLANEEQNSDLFWAVRGAGPGFFAAITAYHLRLHRLPPATCAWRSAHPATDAPLLAGWLTEATNAASTDAEIGCFLMSHWDTGEPAIVLRASACGDDESEARSRIASFTSLPAGVRTIGQPCLESLPFNELFKLSPMPEGKRVAADHLWATGVLGDLLLAVHDIPAPSPHSTIDLVAYGGHSQVSLPGDAPLSIGGGTGVGIYAMWDDPAQDDANRAWVRLIDDALSPFRSGRYVGEADLTVSPDRFRQCFAPETIKRLHRLRQEYDPGGLFFSYP